MSETKPLPDTSAPAPLPMNGGQPQTLAELQRASEAGQDWMTVVFGKKPAPQDPEKPKR